MGGPLVVERGEEGEAGAELVRGPAEGSFSRCRCSFGGCACEMEKAGCLDSKEKLGIDWEEEDKAVKGNVPHVLNGGVETRGFGALDQKMRGRKGERQQGWVDFCEVVKISKQRKRFLVTAAVTWLGPSFNGNIRGVRAPRPIPVLARNYPTTETPKRRWDCASSLHSSFLTTTTLLAPATIHSPGIALHCQHHGPAVCAGLFQHDPFSHTKMITLKSAAAFCPSRGIFSAIPPLAITSPCRPRGRMADSPPHCARHYASVHQGQSGSSGNSHNWPRWPSTPNPTPYEIFGQAKTAPYSKVRFYELVKLYHPDRHHHTSNDGIPHLTKLERYRLVVAANDLLSDPARRRLYDLYGMGWEQQTDIRGRCREADHAWRREPGNASMNATWEDWERWRQEQNGEKQEPLFMSNGTFVMIVASLGLIGGWGHLISANTHGANLVDMQEEKHSSIRKEIRRRESQTANLSRQDRVEHFLKQREGWGYDLPNHGLTAEDIKAAQR